MKPRSTIRVPNRLAVLATFSSCMFLQMAHAASLYWDVNGTDANTGATATGAWDGIVANWNSDSTGAAGGSIIATTTSADSLFFSSGADHTGAFTVTIAAGTQNANSLTYEEGTVTVSGGTPASGVTPGALAFGTSSTVTVAAGVTGLLNASLSGSNGLTKTGAGNLLLGTTNIYNSGLTGTISIKEGALSAGSSASSQNATNGLPISLGDTTGSAAATFSVNRNQNYNSTVLVNAGSTGIKRISGGPGLTAQQAPSITGAITLNDDLILGNGTTPVYSGNNYGGVRLSGVITGNKKITVNGTNDFTTPQNYTTNITSATLATTMAQISGANTTSFTGNVSVERGALVIQNAGAIGNGTALVTTAPGGVLNLANQSISISGLGNGSSTGGSVANLGASLTGTVGTSTLTLRGGGNYSYGGVIQDGTFAGSNTWKVALTLNMLPGGSQTLTGANTYTGNTTITAGTLNLSSTGSLKFAVTPVIDATTNKISGAGTANLDGTINIDLTNAGSPSVGDVWTLVGSASKSFGSTFAVASPFAETSPGSGIWVNGSWYFSELSGKLAFGKTPELIWDGDSGGNWSVAGNWVAGAAPVTGDTVVFTGSNTTNHNDLDTGTAGSVALEGIIFGPAASSFALAGNAVNLSGKSISNLSSNAQTLGFDIEANNGFSVNTSGGSITITGSLNTTAGFNKVLAKNGSGTLILNGSQNTSWALQVNGGTVQALNPNNAGQVTAYSCSIAAGATLKLESGDNFHFGLDLNNNGTLDISENGESFGSLLGSGAVTNHGASSAVTCTISLGSGDSNFAGSIQNGPSGSPTAVTLFDQNILDATTYSHIFSGTNTYTGSTTISDENTVFTLTQTGSLAFKPGANGVTNRITGVDQSIGTGSVILDGTFNIDLTGAAISNGNQWLLVDVTNLNEDFNSGGTFNVAGFSDPESDGTWTKVDDNKTWTFNEATGALSLAVTGGAGYSTWASSNGIPGEPADGDFDKDGLTNLEEYALGKSPTASSTPAGTFSGNTITFTKGADAITNGDVEWIIETSTTLAPGSWTEEAAVEVGNTIAYTFTPGSPATKFARLKVVLTTP